MTAKARDLVISAMDNGWSVVYRPNVDTGGSPFVTVEASRGDQYFSATWHTRNTGTYRLFNVALGRSRHNARDATLTQVIAAVESENPCG